MTSISAIQYHPIDFLQQLIHGNKTQDLIFTFSRYEVAPPGLQAAALRSPTFSVSSDQVDCDWLKDRLDELSPAEELAWHSVVESSGEIFHIPMIDFQCPRQNEIIDDFYPWLQDELGKKFTLFRTGRSFHGYSPTLIRDQDWPTYLGKLLLLNGHNLPPIVDTRWVGHSLIRGFSALRWSHNTARYLSAPYLIK